MSETLKNNHETTSNNDWDMSDITFAGTKDLSENTGGANKDEVPEIHAVYHDGNSEEDRQIRAGLLTEIRVDGGATLNDVQKQLNYLKSQGKNAFAYFNDQKIDNWTESEEAESWPDTLEEKKDVLESLDDDIDIPSQGKYGLVGLMSGVKQATAMDWVEDAHTAQQENKNIESIFDNLGLHYIKQVSSSGATPADYSDRRWVSYYVSKTKEFAELAKDLSEKSREENQAGDATRKLGQLFGYPRTAIEYYVQSNQNGRTKHYHNQPKYHSYIHSPGNEEKEYQQYEQRIDKLFSHYCPASAYEFFQENKKLWQSQSGVK